MIHVIGLGLGPEHLGPAATRLLATAQVVAGGKRLLDSLNIPADKRLPLTTVPEFAARLRDRAATDPVCVVADGDPLLYGLGSTLLRFFDRSELCFHPNVSALQAACACFGLAWQDCHVLSLHGRPDLIPLFAALTRADLVGVFTDPERTPAHIAQKLSERGVTGWCMHVAERLGGPDQRLSTLDLGAPAELSHDPLNMVLLERTSQPLGRLGPGIAEDDLEHQDGLITKRPVRAMALSLLRLKSDSILWDLGAGSGAVSLEAAGVLTHGHVTAVERDTDRIAQIRVNLARFGAWNVEPIHRDLDQFLTDATAVQPTHVFFGGGVSDQTLSLCCRRLQPGGRLVVTAVLLSTLEQARRTLDELGWPLTVHQLSHHQSRPLGRDLRLVPDNPVFLLETQKPSSNT